MFQTIAPDSEDGLGREQPATATKPEPEVVIIPKMESPADNIVVIQDERDARLSGTKCGSCDCSPPCSAGVVEVSNCQVGQSGYVEIVGIDSPVADISKVMNDPNLSQQGFLIKDNLVEILDGLQNIDTMILENNINLELNGTNSVKIATLELRRNAMASFKQSALVTYNLKLSNLVPSSMKDFADEASWEVLVRNIETLFIEGELLDLVPLERTRGLKVVTMRKVWSKKQELLHDNFLSNANKLQHVAMEDSTQVSLPTNFVTNTLAKDISFVLNADNVQKQSLDLRSGVKSLNEVPLTEEQKEVLTSSDNPDKCAIFCKGNNCQQDQDEISKKNCAICVKNIGGSDDKIDNHPCYYMPQTTDCPASTTVSVSQKTCTKIVLNSHIYQKR